LKIAGRVNRLLTLDSLVLPGVVLMELLAAYPWLEWFASLPFRPVETLPLGLASALVIILFPTLAARLALQTRLSLGKARAAVLAPSLLLMLLLVRLGAGGGYGLGDPAWLDFARRNLPAVGAGLAMGIWLLWRGVSVGSAYFNVKSVQRLLLTGAATLAVLSLLWLITTGGDTSGAGQLRHYVLGFFAIGMLTSGVAGFANVDWPSGAGHWSGPSFRHWLLVVSGTAGILILLGWLLAGALAFDSAQLLAPLGVVAEWLLTALVYVIGYPVGFLLTGVAWVVALLRGWFGQQPLPTRPEAPNIAKWLEESRARSGAAEPLVAFEVLKWLILALVIGAVIFLIVRAFRRSFYRADSGEVSEERQSLWSWRSLGDDLGAPFRRLAGLRRRRAEGASPIWDEETGLPPDPRAVYARLLEEGRLAGQPRRETETPLEYILALGPLAGGEKPGLEEITASYMAYRYGGEAAGTDKLGRLRETWLRLRDRLRARGTDEAGDAAPGNA
jgi:hypothetical protein